MRKREGERGRERKRESEKEEKREKERELLLVWISLFCKYIQKLSVIVQQIPNQSN